MRTFALRLIRAIRPSRPCSGSTVALWLGLWLAVAVLPAVAAETAPTPPACGAVQPRALERCDGKQRCRRVDALAVPDYWHGLAQCMRGLRDIWSRRGPTAELRIGDASIGVAELVRRQVDFAMSQSYVGIVPATAGRALRWADVVAADGAPRRELQRVVLMNDLGQPYNAMGQSGLSYFLYQLAALAKRGGYEQATADEAAYRALARGAIRTVVTPVDDGGLATIERCGHGDDRVCAWYHSITRRDRATRDGATLNQDLHAIRDLGQIADFVARQRWDEGIDFESAVRQGLNQLAFGEGGRERGAPPNLSDFLSKPAGSDGVRWAYYGYNPSGSDGRRAYFLGRAGKDCSYHFHVLDLMSQILERDRHLTNAGGAGRALLACEGPLAQMQRAATIRLRTPDRADGWSTPAAGRDYSCPKVANRDEAADAGDNQGFLTRQLADCPSRR